MGCDLCGADGPLFETRIEGTVMTVCQRCSTYGEVIRRVPEASSSKKESKEQAWKETPKSARAGGERLLLVTDDYGPRIKQARERLGLKQEELARRLRMKESQLHKYETGSKKPDLETARLLEKALKITLVESYEEQAVPTRKESASGPLTIGDLLKR